MSRYGGRIEIVQQMSQIVNGKFNTQISNKYGTILSHHNIFQKKTVFFPVEVYGI